MEHTRKLDGVFAFFIAMIALVAIGGVAAITTTPMTLNDIATHNTATNCWSALDGKVYDLSTYIPSHPGGSTMVPLCGIDGTQMLASKHGLGFLSIVGNLQIGVLTTTTTVPNSTTNGTTNTTNSSAPKTSDTAVPTIVVLGANPATVVIGSPYVDAGATASDNIDGDLTPNITKTSNVNTGAIGSYTVTYRVTDSSGNNATATRTVLVVQAQGSGAGETQTGNTTNNSVVITTGTSTGSRTSHHDKHENNERNEHDANKHSKRSKVERSANAEHEDDEHTLVGQMQQTGRSGRSTKEQDDD